MPGAAPTPRAALVRLFLVLAGVVPLLAQTPPSTTVLRDVAVVDVAAGTVARRTVVVRGERIADLLPPASPGPDGAAVVDGRGRFLIPGLWDMHVHLSTRPEPRLAEDIALPLLLAHGIVGAREMGGPLERVTTLRGDLRAGRLAGPRLLIAGPFIDGPGDEDATFRRVAGAASARTAVHALADAGVDFIKVQAGLSRDAYAAVMSAAREHALPVAGHVPVALSVREVLEAGQRSLEHVSPALVSDGALLFACSSREEPLHAELQAIERDRATQGPEAIRSREIALRRALVDTFDGQKARHVGQRIRQAGAWIVPTLVWSARFRPVSAADDGDDTPLEYVPAATRGRWREARARYIASLIPADFETNAAVVAVSARAVAALHRGGAQVLAGTDAFDAFVIPGASLHEELRRLVDAGLSPRAALQAATSSAAAYRGVPADEGLVIRGAVADLVLLDANPLEDIRNASRIAAVVQRGRMHDRAALDALLASARAAAARP
jgi:imidazolonepropionase-like amidohydrolase